MTAALLSVDPTSGPIALAARLVDVSSLILSCVECDDLDEALRLTEERGRLIAALVASGARGSEIETLLCAARQAGHIALTSASRRATELHEELSALGTGRSGLSAYDPGAAGGGSLDVSR